MIENFNPFITLGGKDKKVNDMAYAAIEMNKECSALKKELNFSLKKIPINTGSVINKKVFIEYKVLFFSI